MRQAGEADVDEAVAEAVADAAPVEGEVTEGAVDLDVVLSAVETDLEVEEDQAAEDIVVGVSVEEVLPEGEVAGKIPSTKSMNLYFDISDLAREFAESSSTISFGGFIINHCTRD